MESFWAKLGASKGYFLSLNTVMVSSSSSAAKPRVAIALQSANTSEASRCQLL